jgi:hypothetical protein
MNDDNHINKKRFKELQPNLLYLELDFDNAMKFISWHNNKFYRGIETPCATINIGGVSILNKTLHSLNESNEYIAKIK